MSSMSLTVEETVTLPLSKQDGLERISENGLEVLRRRYLRKGLDGKPAETVQEMFWRVASNVALPERAYSGEAEYQAMAERFYDLLTELRFFPNSPTFTGAGTPLGADRRRQRLQLQPPAPQERPGQQQRGRGQRAGGVFESLRRRVWRDRPGGYAKGREYGRAAGRPSRHRGVHLLQG